MKNRKRVINRFNFYVFVVGGILLSNQFVMAQSRVDCKKLLVDYNQKMIESMVEQSSDHTLFMDIEFTSVPYTHNQEATSDRGLIYAKKGKMIWDSPNYLLMTDEKDAIVILPKLRTIYLSNGFAEGAPELRATSSIGLQDSLLKYSKVSTCKDMVWEGKPIKYIEVQLTGNYNVTKSKIEKVSYWYGLKENRLLKVYVSYDKDAQLNDLQVQYHSLDMKCTKITLKQGVHKKVFSSNGKLLPKYSGYKLINNKTS